MEERKNNAPRMGHGRRDRLVENSNDFKVSIKKIVSYVKKYAPVIIIALVCSIAGTILHLIGPDKLSELTNIIKDGIMTGIDFDAVTQVGVTLIVFYAAGWLLSVVQSLVMAHVTQNVSKSLRRDISLKINKLPMWYFNKTSTGDVLSRVTNDVDTVSQSLNMSVGTLVSAITLFVGSLVMMLKTNVTMTFTAIGATVIGFILMSLIMGRSQKYFSRQQKALGAVNGEVEEIYSGHTVVKAYNGEEKARTDFGRLNEELRDAGFKAQCLSGLMMPLMGFIGNLGYVAVCVVGAALAMNGDIKFGAIVAFIMYVRYFTQPLSQMAQTMQSMQSAAAAGERVFEFLEAEEMEDESEKSARPENIKGNVEFSHVKFGYHNSERIIIHDFSAEARSGQKIAIVGPTGAGKTTMVNLLMRFHEINDGEIKIDGVSTKDMKRGDVHSLFCTLPFERTQANTGASQRVRYTDLLCEIFA